MVLYIFHVNTGGMLTFEMEVALQTVQNLKETIERLHGIPSLNQVLLISGGEVLQPLSRVCSYSSGTDENPIYMFSTLFDNLKYFPPWPSIESHIHYEEEVNRCLTMPAEYNTVVVRAKLAHKMFESATKEIKVCEKLVFEQHLQQQGWAAVMANLEDLTNEFKQRTSDFLNTINDYVEQRPNYLGYLNTFHDDLNKLSTVPILNELLPSAQSDFHGFDEYLRDNNSFTGSSSGSGNSRGSKSSDSTGGQSQKLPQEPNDAQEDAVFELSEQQQTRSLTLLQWISTKENHKSLKDMADDCLKVLTSFDSNAIKYIKGTIKHTLDNAEQENIREVRGLTQRLEQLDELMDSAKKTVQEQKELSTAFQQNQSRASNLGDPSILPDLCMSHSSHLSVMLTNHNKLLDIEKRIMKAKEELGDNLIKRLKYVVHIQNSISDLDSKLLFHHRCFRRLKHHLIIIEQIHHAPSMYVTAVTEVVRRKTFSNHFLAWANDLANHLLTIHDVELSRRQDFAALFENHFLNALFNGLDDMPPPFATRAPTAFDVSLPNLSQTDLDTLAISIPDIESKISLPDLKDLISFFSNRQFVPTKLEECEAKVRSLRPVDIHAHLRDGFESETDTEEFEKVGQSPIDRQRTDARAMPAMSTTITTVNAAAMATTFCPKPETTSMSTSTEQVVTQDSSTLTEENLSSTQMEVDKLKQLLKSMSQLSLNSISLLRAQLNAIKEDSHCDKVKLADDFRRIEEMWLRMKTETENNERELINRLTVDHELELNDLRKVMLAKDDEIAILKCDNNALHTKLSTADAETKQRNDDTEDEIRALKARVADLEKQVNESQIDKEKAVNMIKDKLIRDHKTEIESLRCRFKLMTTTERSPSDTSLEKIDRSDMLDCDRNRPTILASSPKSLGTCQGMYKRALDALEEKERHIDLLNQQIEVLTCDNEKLKEIVGALTDNDQQNEANKLKEQVESLQKDKIKLKQKLNTERTRRMEAAAVEKSSELSKTSSQRLRFCTKRCIRIDACDIGDTALVVWNSPLHRYVIVQPDSHFIHFLAEDSHPLFDLPVPNTKDVLFDNIENKPLFFLGTVVDKQYCMVKKEGTRYRVPIGTKFCRMKLRPFPLNSNNVQYFGENRAIVEIVKRERHDSEKSYGRPLPVSRSLSIQLIDSFAQTDVLNPLTDDKMNISIADKDMVDSGVVAQLRTSDRTSITEEDEGAVSITYDDRYRCVSVSEEDEAVVVDNRSSQEKTKSNQGGNGLFTLIEPLINPIHIILDK